MKKGDLKVFVLIYLVIISISFGLIKGIDKLRVDNDNVIVAMNR